MIYVFGGFLIITGVKMLREGDQKLEPEKNPVVRLFQRLIPLTHEYHGQRFFIRQQGKVRATLLMLVLVVVETTDLIFAVDSIPAIFAITRDPFIVYTSNVFAILGLRALYFMLAGVMEMFTYLKVGLSFVLCFVGAKMIIVDFYKIPIGMSLGIIGAILTFSVIASLVAQWKEQGVLLSRLRLEKIPVYHGWRRRQPARVPVFARVWFLLVLTASVLTIINWTSIGTGPSGHEAITVIRVTQQELHRAQARHREKHPQMLDYARSALDSAWASFEEKRYEEAIQAAHEAGRLLRKIR
jgi:hypothetical protein